MIKRLQAELGEEALFDPDEETHVRRVHRDHWDVTTIIEALEELYPLQAEHKHLDLGSRWQQVIDNSVRRVRSKCAGILFMIRTILSKCAGILFMSGAVEQ